MRSGPPHRRLAAAVVLALAAASSAAVAQGGSAPGVPALTAPGATLAPATLDPTSTVGRPGTVRYRPLGCVPHAPFVNRQGPARHREVAIGFDDGPWTDTARFLAVLERYHVHATFFLIGRQLSGQGALLTRMLRDGDVLGNHTWSHPYLTRSGDAASELSSTSDEIARLSGYRPCVFRPPYGAYDNSVVSAARSLGLSTILWNVDPRDWALPGSPAIEQAILAQVQPGSIIILHDGGGPRGETLDALPHVFADLHRRGLHIVTVLHLLGYSTIYRRCKLLCDDSAISGPLPPGSRIRPN